MAAIERKQESSSLETKEQKPQLESIFNHYSVENEADFLRKIRHLPESERHLYVRENVLGFLGEYVGHIPYKKISYVLRDNGLTFSGISMNDTYQNIMRLSGEGSREWNESLGMLKAQEQLMETGEQGNSLSNVVTVFSPPKIADYAFAFHFRKGVFSQELQGTVVEEYILRYPEKMGDVARTMKIASALHPEASVAYQDADDFLKKPVSAFSVNPENELTALLRAIGIDKSLIAHSQLFEKIASRELSSWIDHYYVTVSELALLAEGSVDYCNKQQEAELYLTALFNKAQEIKSVVDEDPLRESRRLEFPEDTQHAVDSQEFAYYAYKQEAMVSGGSCPIVKKGLGQFISNTDILASLKQNIPVNTALEFFSGDNETWEYHDGNCIVCHKTGTDVGPCNICKECEKKFD